MEKLKGLSNRRKEILWLWALMLAVSIVIRCLPTIIYPQKILEYVVIMGLAIVSILLYCKDIEWKKFNICDMFFLITPIFFLSGLGTMKYMFFVIISLAFYVVIQKETSAIDAVKYPIFIFAVITSVVTWISFFAPEFYKNYILTLFPEGQSLIESFLNENMYHGFTNHYSRNSFYITIAILLEFCEILSKKCKNQKISIGLLAFFMCTQFLVAKRGLTLFMLVTMFLIVFLMGKDIQKKIKNSILFVIVGVILFVIAYIFVPGVDNMVTRIFTPNASGDISSGRFYLYGIAFEMFKEHPVLGNGWGSFLKAMEGTTFQGVHNDYLQLLAEVGMVGFIVFMIANLGCMYFSYKGFKIIRDKEYENKTEKMWMMFSFSYQIFFMLYSLTGLPHFSYEQITLYILLCGYAMGMYKQWKNKGETI